MSYASANVTPEGWGPVLFRPSRRSLVILLIAAGAFAWLAWRHEAWVAVAAVAPPNGECWGEMWMHNGGVLLAWNRQNAIVGWDGRTGRRLYDVDGLGASYVARVTGGGRRLLLVGWDGHGGQFLTDFDVPTGRIVTRKFLPDGVRVEDVLPERDMILYVRPHPSKGLRAVDLAEFGLLKLSDPGGGGRRRLFEARDAPREKISPDGATVLLIENHFPWGDLEYVATLREIPTGRPVLSIRCAGEFEPAFSEDGSSLVVLAVTRAKDPNGTSDQPVASAVAMERYSTRTGEKLASVAFEGDKIDTRTLLPRVPDGIAVSLDGLRVAAVGAEFGGFVFPLTCTVTVFDTGAGRVLSRAGVMYDEVSSRMPIRFFPDGRRFAVVGPRYGETSVYGMDASQPLAVMKGPQRGVLEISISPDGSWMATRGDDHALRAYRRVGWECRESRLGVLGFPHAWLLAGAVSALALSLRSDALRAPGASETHLISAEKASLILVAAALPRTVWVVVGLASGMTLPASAAPLLLLCAIGLGTGSRFWRAAVLAALAVQLSLNLYWLRKLHQHEMALRTAVLDRTWYVPWEVMLAILGAATVGVGVALFQMCRRTRPA
jgi:hypothetical protein